jgi:hypothetical protein
MKSYIAIVFLAFLFIACAEETVEPKAATMLEMSRMHLSERRYDAARDSILSLRRKYPTAIEERAQALLLLDSVEMLAAQDSMKNAQGEEWKRLSVKAEFFQRKIEVDKKKLAK